MWLRTISTVLVTAGLAGAVDLTVAATGGNATSPLQYGVIFEDINHSGDGGIYAELIQNRAFQGNSTANVTTFPWMPAGGASLSISEANPLSSALPYSIQVDPSPGDSQAGIINPGFWGINVVPQVYDGSFWVRGNYNGSFTVALQSNLTDQTFASKQIPAVSTASQWTQVNFTLNPPTAASNVNNSFALTFDPSGAANGALQFNLISLFPPTFNGRANGMRIDLMETLQGLSPSFMRFPGGNNLEGGKDGQWGYYNTDGLGLDEYLDWCVDLDMEPILGVWDGLYLDNDTVAQSGLDPYVENVLDELEYILGSTDTQYGALRAQYGHPDPWKLNYVEIGNEDDLSNGLASYASYRFSAFQSAISKAYPALKVIASTTYLPLPADVAGDYHDYTRPDIFTNGFSLFDHNSSTNPTLIGEYAVIQQNNATPYASANTSDVHNPYPVWLGSIAEAIFLLGAERNADAVIGAAYAPSFQNLDSYAWAPDLISFTVDPSQTVRSTSYHVEQLLSQTRFTETRGVRSSDPFGPAYWAAGENTYTNSYILKAAVYNTSEDVPMTVSFDGVQPGTQANLTMLTAGSPTASASIGSDPVNATSETLTAGAGGSFNFSMPGLSVAVLETKGTNGYGGTFGYGGYGGCKNGGQRGSYNWEKWSCSGQKGNGC